MWAGSYNTVAVAKSGEVPFIFIVTFSYYLVGFFLLPLLSHFCVSFILVSSGAGVWPQQLQPAWGGRGNVLEVKS